MFIVLHSRGIRRGLCALFLAVATFMVIIGGRLYLFISPESLVIYWTIVFLLLFLTVLISILDIRSLRRDFRIQKKALFVSTFSDEDFLRKIKEKHPEIFQQND